MGQGFIGGGRENRDIQQEGKKFTVESNSKAGTPRGVGGVLEETSSLFRSKGGLPTGPSKDRRGLRNGGKGKLRNKKGRGTCRPHTRGGKGYIKIKKQRGKRRTLRGGTVSKGLGGDGDSR